jgi:hypothetical protein
LWADRNAIPCEPACHLRREDEVLGAFVDRSGVMRYRIGHARDHGRGWSISALSVDHQLRDATLQSKSKLASAEQICVQQFAHSIALPRSTKNAAARQQTLRWPHRVWCGKRNG